MSDWTYQLPGITGEVRIKDTGETVRTIWFSPEDVEAGLPKQWMEEMPEHPTVERSLRYDHKEGRLDPDYGPEGMPKGAMPLY